MIRVRLAQLLADLQYRQTLLLQHVVETSRDLRRFNALANPDFVIPKLPPGGDMSFAPGQEARFHLGSLPTGGLNEHLYVLFAGHQRDILFQQLAPTERAVSSLTTIFLSVSITTFSHERKIRLT